MTDSFSFDRAADFYDSTRDLPEPVATQGIQAFLDAVGPGARILDVGTGTGRISVPLLKRGADLVGCDLSARMMARLQVKFPAARLAQADASQLPFPASYFDAVTTCHVMHLVGPWREALREYRRVLKSGGVYVNARTEQEGESVHEQVRGFWKERVEALGFVSQRPGVRDDQDQQEELRSLGAELKQVEVVRFTASHSVREEINRLGSRKFSSTWDIPEDVFVQGLHDLREWAGHEYADLDAPHAETAAFILDVARFRKS